jgi:hypothetical protein
VCAVGDASSATPVSLTASATWYRADAGIRDGRIARISRLDTATATRTIDAGGRVLATGFHRRPWATTPSAPLARWSQGRLNEAARAADAPRG